jgi:hypothetical protein
MKPTARPPFIAPRRWEAIYPIAGAIIIDIVFDRLGQPARGTLAVASAVGLFTSTRMSWRLHKEWWFWITMTTLLAIHMFAILALPWSGADYWNGFIFIPLALADVVCIMTVIYIVYRKICGKPDQIFGSD